MGDGGRFWQVQAVLGDDEHQGFAYTMGLAEQGLHELHMWDRPTHGDDPGADYWLSSADLCRTLNEYAEEWAAGSLRMGDVRELSLDDGLTTAVITFGEPVDADDVEAWGARPSMVVPLRWSLHRPPCGERVPILPDARQAYEQDVRQTAAMSDPRVRVSGALVPGDEITFDVDGPYGPLSALVEAHALAMAGTAAVDVLLSNVLDAGFVASPGALMGRMATLSRLSGRDEQVGQVHLLAHRVVDRLVKRRAWRNTVTEAARTFGMTTTRAQGSLEHAVGAWLMTTLMGLALDDVLPDDMVLAAQGPWRATLSATGADPGQRWRCSPKAEQLIRRAFAALDVSQLRHLVHAMTGPIADLLGADLMRARGFTLTTAVAPPQVTDLVLTPHLERMSPLVMQQLSSFAQLMACVVDGVFPLDEARFEQIGELLGWGVDQEWWNAA